MKKMGKWRYSSTH